MISVVSLGQRPRDWLPESTVPGHDVLLPHLRGRYNAFVRYLQHRLDDLDITDGEPPSERVILADDRRGFATAIAIASDPSSISALLEKFPIDEEDLGVGGRTLDVWLLNTWVYLKSISREMSARWFSPTDGQRPHADKVAQATVRGWYGNKCVLTGSNRTLGAHIVPVRVTKHGRLAEIWTVLCQMQGLDQLADLSYRGHEPTNILPLAASPHGRWDDYEFYLRPIPDPVRPDTRLYLQFFWSDEQLAVGNERSDGTLVDISNGRCPLDNSAAYPALQSGDVFCLETADPVRYPLPKLEFLRIQYGVYRMQGSLKAAAILSRIFHGGPPPDDEDDGNDGSLGAAMLALEDDDDLEHMWRVMLQTALDKDVLSPHDVRRWARAFAKQVRQRRLFFTPQSERHQQNLDRAGEA